MGYLIEEMRQKALSLVGQGYIYGAKGQICSLRFREQQAAQYPKYASIIMTTGAKWDGKPVWDCAQLTRAVAKMGGVELPSGATSQWSRGPWKRKGEIATLPKGELCFLYRRQSGSDTVMSHTGVALGDGRAVDARGTEAGVLLAKADGYPWTHWAVPWGLPDSEQQEDECMDGTGSVYRVMGGRLALRSAPSKSASLIAWLPDGSLVTVLADDGEWCRVRSHESALSNREGYSMKRYLEAVEDGSSMLLRLDRLTAQRLLEALQDVLDPARGRDETGG